MNYQTFSIRDCINFLGSSKYFSTCYNGFLVVCYFPFLLFYLLHNIRPLLDNFLDDFPSLEHSMYIVERFRLLYTIMKINYTSEFWFTNHLYFIFQVQRFIINDSNLLHLPMSPLMHPTCGYGVLLNVRVVHSSIMPLFLSEQGKILPYMLSPISSGCLLEPQ